VSQFPKTRLYGNFSALFTFRLTETMKFSSGYEGWNCGTSSGFEVIGMGGGGTANSKRDGDPTTGT
jgi:hypothetical protein